MELVFYCALMVFSVNIRGLLLWKVKMRSNYKAFQKVLKNCNQTPNKMLVDKVSEFYNMGSTQQQLDVLKHIMKENQ